MEQDSLFDLGPEQLNRLLSIGSEEDGSAEAGEDKVLVAPNGSGAVRPGVSLAGVIEQPGGWIGRYRLLAVLGEGGMGVVYLAEQKQPLRRKVALKVVKPGMDSARVIGRFEAERQALALLDHPNIAHVYDAGTTEAGRPYFVMEYVEGLPITDYCDRQKLTIEQRLRLFAQVCEAVQHAHQKGIIHRDLKPSNILVAAAGNKAIPKIIDFGVAKAISQPLTERTLLTEDTQLLGTPAYMSPEQAQLSDVDIDTRADIYSLGVLLYELLVGATPFNEADLRRAGYPEMQRIIREDEPDKPSTRLGALSTTLAKVAQRRSATPEALRKLVRGDLDWIVMKSLAKARSQRYDTASALALDVRRHLDHEPVLARGPGAAYRLQKFLRRHRVETAALLVLATTVSVVGAIGSMWRQDRRQLVLGEASRHRAVLSQARESHAKGQHAAALRQISPVLASNHVGPEAQLLYAGILVEGQYPDEAVTMLEELLDSRPEIAGAAHSLLARILWESPSRDVEALEQLNEHQQKAEELLPETAEAYFLRAMTTLTIREKLNLLDKALDLDPDHYESYRMRAFTHYASRQYDRMRDDALAMIVLRPQDPLGYSLRAMTWHELGRFSEAVAEYDRALGRTAAEAPSYVELSGRRCAALMEMGQYERVLADAQSCLEHAPHNMVLQSQVLCTLTALGRYEHVDALMRRITELYYATDNEVRLQSMKHVFDTLVAGGRWHPRDRKPEGPAFFYMLEAEEMYRGLRAKARRLITNGFAPCWSPDGTKVAYAHGLPGYSGVAVYDLQSQETTLLTVPGKDPRWSPDGRHIAFVRDAPALRLSELTTGRTRRRTQDYRIGEEVWVMEADGSAPRRLARQAHCPSWNADGRRVYYHVWYDHKGPDGATRPGQWLYAISIDDLQAQPVAISPCVSEFPAVTPQGDYVADLDGGAESGAVLRIRNVETQACIAEWATPLESATASWSPDGREVSLGGLNGIRARTGLWIYDLTSREGVKVLSGHFSGASWSPDRTRLLISVGKPFWEIWVADLDPALSTAESLGPTQTLEEHCLASIATCTRDLDVDPDSFVNHWTRTTAALWIGHHQAPAYLHELDLRLGQPPARPSLSNFYSARDILAHPALRERLGDLAWILARRAVQQQSRHADELAHLFEDLGQHERAVQLRQIAQADTLSGSYRYESRSDAYTVVGGGAGIAGVTDEFHFVYNDLEGDGSITARIESIDDAHVWTKAGVMVRANLDPDAAFAAVLATPGSGVSFHTRTSTGSRATTDDHVATPEQMALRTPVWIRLEREADHFSAFTSSDGVAWAPMAWGPQQVAMPVTVYVGLAVTSHDRRRTAQARISHVTTTGDVGLIGTLRQYQDIRLQAPSPPQ